MMWIDYFYRPEVQAPIADWVWYISPVPDAGPIIAGKLDDPTVADSPFVFPTPAMEKKFVAYYDPRGSRTSSSGPRSSIRSSSPTS